MTKLQQQLATLREASVKASTLAVDVAKNSVPETSSEVIVITTSAAIAGTIVAAGTAAATPYAVAVGGIVLGIVAGAAAGAVACGAVKTVLDRTCI